MVAPDEPNSTGSRPKRSGTRVILPAALALIALGAGLYWNQRRHKPPTSQQNPPAEATSFAPPFATKEPQRYQATRVTTSNVFASGKATNELDVSRVFVARDGEKRREDYELDGIVVSYLEVPPARYALLLSQRIYTDLNTEEGVEVPAHLASEFSPDRLLNQSPAASHYEFLGQEVVNGRSTTRYRVTLTQVTAADTIKSETLIWVDQSLGMPIKSETTTVSGEVRSRFTTEMESISTEVEGRVFELPHDARKVSRQEFERQLRTAKP